MLCKIFLKKFCDITKTKISRKFCSHPMFECSEGGGWSGLALAHPPCYRRLYCIHLPFSLFSNLSSIILWVYVSLSMYGSSCYSITMGRPQGRGLGLRKKQRITWAAPFIEIVIETLRLPPLYTTYVQYKDWDLVLYILSRSCGTRIFIERLFFSSQKIIKCTSML